MSFKAIRRPTNVTLKNYVTMLAFNKRFPDDQLVRETA